MSLLPQSLQSLPFILRVKSNISEGHSVSSGTWVRLSTYPPIKQFPEYLCLFASRWNAPLPPSLPPCCVSLACCYCPLHLGSSCWALQAQFKISLFPWSPPPRRPYLHFAVSPVFTFHSNLFAPLRWDNTRLGQLSVLLNAWQMINLESCCRSRDSVYVINFLWEALKLRLLRWSMDYYYYKNIEAIIVWIYIPNYHIIMCYSRKASFLFFIFSISWIRTNWDIIWRK